MDKEQYYLVKEDFRHQAKAASFYDILTEMCDIYPVAEMTVQEARDFMLSRVAQFELKLMESMSVECVKNSCE